MNIDSFNHAKSRNHPERLPGERWLTNHSGALEEIEGYQTKRRGKVAYDCYGNTVENSYPVFVSQDERFFANEKQP